MTADSFTASVLGAVGLPQMGRLRKLGLRLCHHDRHGFAEAQWGGGQQLLAEKAAPERCFLGLMFCSLLLAF